MILNKIISQMYTKKKNKASGFGWTSFSGTLKKDSDMWMYKAIFMHGIFF